MTKANKRKLHRFIRGLIQLFFFIMAPEIFSTAFAGIRHIFEYMGNSEPVVLDAFISLLIVVLAYTVVFGRFFCGYACAFGSLGDAVYGISSIIQRKVIKKKFDIPIFVSDKLRYVKYILLVAIIIACVTGNFERVSTSDPWELFAALISGNFTYKPEYTSASIILLLILIGMLSTERFFCRFLCPMGAAFALMPVLPLSVFAKAKSSCPSVCSACTKICPCNLTLEEDSGECIQCGKCALICPKSNASIGIKWISGNEIWFVLLKAVILFVVVHSF